jgi:hypothetical protein
MTGYAGGLDVKRNLLELEGHRVDDRHVVDARPPRVSDSAA